MGDWREYFRSRNLNLPNQYHNGGSWPFLGGFYTAALVKAGRRAQAEVQLQLLAETVQQGIHSKWEFNEWHHGLTGRPMGHPLQAWSAGLYIYAFHAVKGVGVAFSGLVREFITVIGQLPFSQRSFKVTTHNAGENLAKLTL